MYSLAVLEARSLKSRCWQGWFPLRPLSLLTDDHPLVVSSDGLPTARVYNSQTSNQISLPTVKGQQGPCPRGLEDGDPVGSDTREHE